MTSEQEEILAIDLGPKEQVQHSLQSESHNIPIECQTSTRQSLVEVSMESDPMRTQSSFEESSAKNCSTQLLGP